MSRSPLATAFWLLLGGERVLVQRDGEKGRYSLFASKKARLLRQNISADNTSHRSRARLYHTGRGNIIKLASKHMNRSAWHALRLTKLHMFRLRPRSKQNTNTTVEWRTSVFESLSFSCHRRQLCVYRGPHWFWRDLIDKWRRLKYPCYGSMLVVMNKLYQSQW